MITWSKSELTHSIEMIKKVESYIWLKMNKEVLCAEQHVYMCAIYIPPSESPYHNTDLFNHYKTMGRVLICRDLNTRTGERADTMNTQGDEYLPGGTCFQLPECPARNSFDKLTNKSGTQLLQPCRTLGLCIFNGRL